MINKQGNNDQRFDEISLNGILIKQFYLTHK